MGNPTRARLMELGKTQVDLLREIRKSGYPKCTEPYLSKVNNGLNTYQPQAVGIIKLREEILSEWESEVKGNGNSNSKG